MKEVYKAHRETIDTLKDEFGLTERIKPIRIQICEKANSWFMQKSEEFLDWGRDFPWTAKDLKILIGTKTFEETKLIDKTKERIVQDTIHETVHYLQFLRDPKLVFGKNTGESSPGYFYRELVAEYAGSEAMRKNKFLRNYEPYKLIWPTKSKIKLSPSDLHELCERGYYRKKEIEDWWITNIGVLS